MTTLSSQFDASTRKQTGARIVKRNTFKYARDGETVIRLHNTDIVRKLENGSVVLNSGGWKTPTTKGRMNDHLPEGLRIIQDRGLWYVAKCGSWDKEARVNYFDGMQLPRDYDKPKGGKQAAAAVALRKSIAKFVGKLDKLECLPEPSNRDCWYCAMTTGDGKSWGESSGNVDHVRRHVKEGYLHGSLIMNALKWAGYREPGFIWQLCNRELAAGKKPTWAKRALRRYLTRTLGLVS